MGLTDMFIKPFISKAIERYGELTGFHLDTGDKTISLTVLLKGEPSAVEINVIGYKILETTDGYFASADKIITNREWLNLVLEDYVVNKQYPIPAEYASKLKWIL